mmetsp:Transcript_36565/g.113122  ORF Transcript_36565/g.113122 Transcript_36565/m.113122 type:complete len:287 (+) Transcript_36565:929-1789(+)
MWTHSEPMSSAHWMRGRPPGRFTSRSTKNCGINALTLDGWTSMAPASRSSWTSLEPRCGQSGEIFSGARYVLAGQSPKGHAHLGRRSYSTSTFRPVRSMSAATSSVFANWHRDEMSPDFVESASQISTMQAHPWTRALETFALCGCTPANRYFESESTSATTSGFLAFGHLGETQFANVLEALQGSPPMAKLQMQLERTIASSARGARSTRSTRSTLKELARDEVARPKVAASGEPVARAAKRTLWPLKKICRDVSRGGGGDDDAGEARGVLRRGWAAQGAWQDPN